MRIVLAPGASWPIDSTRVHRTSSKHIDLRRKGMQIPRLRKVNAKVKVLLRAGISLAAAATVFTAALAYSKNSDRRLLVEGFFQGTEVDVFQGSPGPPPDSIAVDGNIPGL